ncbi:two component transcriptional regulator, winged helix family protein [Neobacillus bataviensis LMG 21833]|uniref:Two component transcriptional regulator, winged helix family protein n=1 Tax=Neobacillus bataviensis LMG 21833 TaxID=1117379 RepID=K6DXG7_9BACI|nr:response regulator transcription factor [Neobacillus bataviensis]EKN65526.1 two component transcriptional regulator, winged helix family protein [Neobacillus bataviensis LMG 21833]
MYKVMIVEDDPKISHIIYEHLKKWKYEPFETKNFENLERQFLKLRPDLVLLDINLPVYDGFYWCNKFRQLSKLPIIFISSRTENMDIVMAMNMGGDDFIQKPFSLEVLLAKCNAILRRTYTYQQQDNDYLEHNGLILHVNKGRISYLDDEIDLTKNESQILFMLMKKKETIVSRDEIMQELWESGDFIDDNTLTVNIARLRKKLSEMGLAEFIETRKRQGYIIP